MTAEFPSECGEGQDIYLAVKSRDKPTVSKDHFVAMCNNFGLVHYILLQLEHPTSVIGYEWWIHSDERGFYFRADDPVFRKISGFSLGILSYCLDDGGNRLFYLLLIHQI
ncbi:MAG: hypothetical protein IIB14_08910 [Chloroflexi bacterium]|nr:hypothetical protein [Chloroflexota bacterium]